MRCTGDHDEDDGNADGFGDHYRKKRRNRAKTFTLIFRLERKKTAKDLRGNRK